MIATISQLVILFLFIICGFIIGKLKGIPIEKSNILSTLLVNIFLPAKLFLNFSQRCTLTYLKTNYSTLIISTGIVALLALFSLGASKLLTKNPYERNVYRYSFTISNYAYLGYVLVEATLGAQALTNMILFCIPFSIYTNSFGYSLLTGKKGLVKSMLNPLMISIALGMVFGIFKIPIPAILTTAFSNASACTGPVSMVLTGLVISSFTLKELIPNKETFVFSSIRLILIPLFIFSICMLLKPLGLLSEAIYPAAVIVGCMPCGLNTIVFPLLVGEDCKMGAKFVLFTNIMCLVTIPIWVWILT